MLFRNKGRGRCKTEVYDRWIRAAGMELMCQRPEKHEGRVSIAILASPPDRRKRDLDNLLKPTLDLLVRHRIMPDDSTEFLTSLSISLGTGQAGLDVTVTAV